MKHFGDLGVVLQDAAGAPHWDGGQRGSGALALPPQPDLHGHWSASLLCTLSPIS